MSSGAWIATAGSAIRSLGEALSSKQVKYREMHDGVEDQDYAHAPGYRRTSMRPERSELRFQAFSATFCAPSETSGVAR